MIPLLSVQRVAALYGALAYRVIAVYALLLLLYVARSLVWSRARATMVALHVFSGFPMAALFFLSRSLPRPEVGAVLGAILILHVGAAWYLERRAGLGEATPVEPVRPGGSLTPVRVANAVLVVVIAAVTLLNFQFNLLYGRHILLGILDKAAYPPPVDPRSATMAAFGINTVPIHYAESEVIAYGIVNLVIVLAGIGLVLLGHRIRAWRTAAKNVVTVG